jgi:hypothetical protein
MRPMMFVGCIVVLTAADGWAAEMPVSAPDTGVGVGAPTQLAPAPPSTRTPLVWPVPPSRPMRQAYPARYPMSVYNPYHPHWVVDVFGR